MVKTAILNQEPFNMHIFHQLSDKFIPASSAAWSWNGLQSRILDIDSKAKACPLITWSSESLQDYTMPIHS